MDAIKNAINGKKVYIVLLAGLLGIAQHWAGGDMTSMQAGEAVWGLALAAGFRSALSKIGL